MAVVCGGALADDAPLTLRGEAIALTLGRAEKGAVVSLKTRDGGELAAKPLEVPRLFTLMVSQQADVPGEKSYVSSGDAAAFSAASEMV